jgi:16S rRNA (guanine1516-N2)-methyltransferase
MVRLPDNNVAVACQHPGLLSRARQLAEVFRLPLAEDEGAEFRHLLLLTDQRLELRQTGKGAPGPIFTDFLAGSAEYRRKHGGGRDQAVAKAVGLRGKHLPSVLDTTAGLGGDSFVLACLGCQVQMLERSPVIFALLEDGLKRAMGDKEIGPIIRRRLKLTLGDSLKFLQTPPKSRPEVIYLDPMYPHREKNALAKKEMRTLRAIVGDDQDAHALFRAALAYGAKRVVVKRPRLAPALADQEPDLVLPGKSSRFDVYFP